MTVPMLTGIFFFFSIVFVERAVLVAHTVASVLVVWTARRRRASGEARA